MSEQEAPHQATILIADPSLPLLTTICSGIELSRASTWEMIPTKRCPLLERLVKIRIAFSRLSGSRVPKPSSTNIESSSIPPAFCWMISERDKAKAKLAMA